MVVQKKQQPSLIGFGQICKNGTSYLYLRNKSSIFCFKETIQVFSEEGSSKISGDDSIWIQHWNNDKITIFEDH